MSVTSPSGTLVRRLGVFDAVVIGMGSMVGAGVYSVWSPATRSAGSLMLLGLAFAALIAWLNAISTARLAMIHPQSGGVYVYGREQLGPGWGFVAGWGFVVGKTASCAAMASTIGAYVFPDQTRLVAVVAIVVMTAVNLGGLERTVLVTKVLLLTSLAILGAVVVSGMSDPALDAGRLWPISDISDESSVPDRIYDVMQSAALLFFAFAGYARIATLGEEVKDPVRTIPRAIKIALALVLSIYAAIGFALLATSPPNLIADTSDPLQLLVDSQGSSGLASLVRIGSVIASLGALLNLLPGVSRTTLALARNGDLPRFLARVDPRRSLPVRAELAVAAAAIATIALFDLRSSIALSAVGVLAYYSVGHMSSLTLPSRRRQTLSAVFGLIGCFAMIVCLPPAVASTGTGVLVFGIVLRSFRARLLARRR